jgi:hypothetical protein
MITLKDSPTALTDWLTSEYPRIPPSIVYFTNSGSVNHKMLNPYTSRVIIPYTRDVAHNRIYLHECILYGNEEPCPFLVLKDHGSIVPIDVPLILDDPTEEKEECTLDDIKAHIKGEYFSFETLQIILKVGAYVPHFIGRFLKREMRRDLTRHIKNYGLQRMPDNEVTVTDYQALWNTSQKRQQCIDVWFKIPVKEFGQHTPLYPGGFYHVNITQMNPWIWRYWTLNCAVRRSNMEHPDQANHLLSFIGEWMEEKNRRKHITLLEAGQVDEKLPPCVRRILFGSSFPKDMDRQHVVRVLAMAGVPLDYIETKLTGLNAKDPHNSGPMPLLSRWDYKAHYKAKYAAPNCEIINFCPLAPGKTVDAKKSECYLLFMKTFPEKPKPSGRSFRGPLQWFEW